MNTINIERQLLGHVMLDYTNYINHKDLYDIVNFSGINSNIFKELHGQCITGKINALSIAKKIAPSFDNDFSKALKYLSECKTMIETDQPIEDKLNFLIDSQDNTFTIKLCETLYNMAKAGNTVSDIKQKAFDGFDVISNRLKSQYSTFLDNLSALDKRIHENRQTGKTSGFKTGLLAFDNFTNGLQPTDLMILAARPSMGKTAFAIQAAKNLAIQNLSVAFITYEMSALQLTGRVVANEVEMSSKRLIMEPLNDNEIDKFNKGIQPIQDLPLYLVSPKNNFLHTLESEVAALVFQLGIKVLIIDFIQRMDVKGNANDEAKAGLIAKTLKNLAVSHNISIVALSQLSRSVEQRADKRPVMSDIRQSGQIEEAADIVAFLYRDEYYNHDTDLKGVAELIIAKGRNIGVTDLQFMFNAQYGKFYDADGVEAKVSKYHMKPNTEF